MYKSRQKIIIVSIASFFCLSAFAVGSYFIATSFKPNVISNKTESLYAGATISLENKFNTNLNISLNEFIFSNMVKRIVFTKNTTANANDKSFKIEFIDHTYDSNPINNKPGNTICIIPNFMYSDSTKTISYDIMTKATKVNDSLKLGSYYSQTNQDKISYSFGSYDNVISNLTLDKNISTPTPPSVPPTTSSTETFKNSATTLFDGRYNVEEKIEITTSSNTDATIKSDSLKKTYTISDQFTTSNKIIQTFTKSIDTKDFSIIFSNGAQPETNTNINFTYDKSSTTDSIAYDITYISANLNGTSISTTNIKDYNRIWSTIGFGTSIYIPRSFGTLGLLDIINFI